MKYVIIESAAPHSIAQNHQAAGVHYASGAMRGRGPASSSFSSSSEVRLWRTNVAGMPSYCSCRFRDPKMARSVDKIDHLGCGMDRERMMGEARSW